MRSILIITLTILTSSICYSANYILRGQIKNQKGENIPFATIIISGTQTGAIADAKGKFQIKDIKLSDTSLKVSSIGYTSKVIKIDLSQTQSITIQLEESTLLVDEVVVKAETQATKLERSGFAVSSVDTRELQLKSIEVNDILDQIPGLRVRRDGGLGSRTQYNINGLSGNAVRVFIDGVPMESYGASYSINSIPVSLIERVDVYKGVVPIEFGNDAMGGAINIVSRNLTKKGSHKTKSLNASYSFGSFNTHRTAINGAFKNGKNGLSTSFSAFYNYSDNNYKVWSSDIKVEDYRQKLPDGTPNPDFMVPQNITARRFNDAYKSYGAKVGIGVTDKKWADQLYLSLNASGLYRESQHGPRMLQPYGERYYEGWTVAPSINYHKQDFIIKNLNITSNLQYAISERSVVDTTTNTYNWLGEIVPTIPNVIPTPGEARTATLKIDDNKNFIGKVSSTYNLNKNHQLGLSHSYNHFIRSSDDELQDALLRAYGTKNRSTKQITGLSYQNTFWGEKLHNSIFTKHYYSKLEQNKVELGNSILDTVNFSRPDHNWGYGATSTFALTPKVRFNASIEQAVRLVTNNEVFGNTSSEILESIDLEPEKSLNVNLGGIFTLWESKRDEATLNTNLFYRNTYDRIKRRDVVVGSDSYSLYENIGHIISKGAEAQIDYRFTHSWHLMLQAYYLDARFMEKYDQYGSENRQYKSREPNMPYLTFSGNVTKNWQSVIQDKDQLSLSWHTSYIHEFELYWDVFGDQNTPTIPTQFINDVSLSYTFHKRKVTLSIDGRNIFNQLAFDNYAVQKPGRAFYGKISYRLF